MSANFTPEKEDYKILTPFKMQVLTNFPYIEADFDALTNYQLLCKIVEYLNNVIANENEVTEQITSLYNAYIELQNYVNNYFDNLDVQEEINNKLDDMVLDGTLTSLIANYIDPIQSAFEQNLTSQINERINNYEDEIDARVDNIESQVASATSGSPAGVYATVSALTSADPDHSKIYVVTADGKWYYYNSSTSSWTAGGTYQSTLEELDKTLTQNNKIPNSKSVGDKINDNVNTINYFDKNSYENNKYFTEQGVKTSNNSYFLSNIIKVNNGDSIFANYFNDDVSGYLVNTYAMTRVTKVSALGEYISTKTLTYNQKWTADESCFIQISFEKLTNYTDSNIQNYLCISKNTPPNKYYPYKYNLINDNTGLDDISKYINLFNPNDFSYISSVNANGWIQHTNHYFTTNLIPCKSGDTFYLHYFNNDNAIQFTNAIIYDSNLHLISRNSVNSKIYESTNNGYIKFTCYNPNDVEDLETYLTISKNEQLTEYVPYKRYINDISNTNKVGIEKIDETNFLISFGDFKINLFKTINETTNSNNWNISTITDKNNNTIVPSGTDIIGPIKVNGNTDFIGGRHGDETTNFITISINNNSFDIDEVTSLSGNSMEIIMKSIVYDQLTQNPVANRFITILFKPNSILISNNYKFVASTILNRAPICGLIGCRNPIIKDIIFNNSYYEQAPTSSPNNYSSKNTNATINTIYGSINVRCIKGFENPNYNGGLTTFSSESPIRNKIYFELYKNGTYTMNNGTIISGEFEYNFN